MNSHTTLLLPAAILLQPALAFGMQFSATAFSLSSAAPPSSIAHYFSSMPSMPQPPAAQACTPTAVPVTTSEYDFQLRHGGETRQIEARVTASGTSLWTAEDGGRIRHSPANNQNWHFQVTPPDVNQNLLDIWFEPGSVTHGWAAGRSGHLLRTADGGATWEHFDPSTPGILDSTNCCPSGPLDPCYQVSTAGQCNYATIWRTRWVDSNVGFIAGLYTFKRNGNGTARNASDFQNVKLWSSFSLVNSAATVGDMLPEQVEFYALSIARDSKDPSQFIGFAAGDPWPHCASNTARAVGFFTDSRLPESDGGRNWWMTFDADDFPKPTTGGVMQDPWDVEFQSEFGDLDNMVTYMVGGFGNQDGYLFRSDKGGGKNWTDEYPDFSHPNVPMGASGPFTPTLYGVSAMDDGGAIATGYGGAIWSRNPISGLWDWSPIPGITTPIACAEAGTGQRSYVGGGFGVLRGTVDGGASWPIYLNPAYEAPCAPEEPWRVHDMHFFNDLEGFVVGQFQLIAKTTDGGISFTIQNGDPGNTATPDSSLVATDFKDINHGVAISATNTSSVGTVPWTLYTDDSGANWNAGVVHPSTLAISSLSDVEYSGHQNVYWAVGKKSGGAPLVLYSSDGGHNWYSVAAPPQGVTLTSVAFLTYNQGFAVGYKNSNKQARAFRLKSNGLGWDDVSPTEPIVIQEDRQLLGVDARGSSYANAEALCVGNNGCVFRYDASIGLAGRFVDVTGLYERDANGVATLKPTDLGLRSISMAAPSNSTILIGTEGYSYDRCVNDWKTLSPQLGSVLRYDGSGWEMVRASTDKDHARIQLTGPDQGFLLGGSTGPQNHANTELGAVGDWLLLRYLDLP